MTDEHVKKYIWTDMSRFDIMAFKIARLGLIDKKK